MYLKTTKKYKLITVQIHFESEENFVQVMCKYASYKLQ